MEICQIFSPFLAERGMLMLSFHVPDVADLIHIVRSGRTATFNDCIHMHLMPYLKSQITPSANDEMIRSHCPPDIGFEIRALAVRGRARYHSVMEVQVLHTILTSGLYE